MSLAFAPALRCRNPLSLGAALVFGFLGLSIAPVPLQAHSESEVAIAELTSWIQRKPDQPSLYLARSRHFFHHEHWSECEADLRSVERLNPAFPGLDMAYVELLAATRRDADLLPRLERVLRVDPGNTTALILRARLRARGNDADGANADFSSAIDALAEPRPELYLERAALRLPLPVVLQQLDQGISRIGPATALVERALTLELEMERFDDALKRLDQLVASAERPEFLLKRQADLLARLARPREAHALYARSRAALASRPEWLQNAPESRRLDAELRAVEKFE